MSAAATDFFAAPTRAGRPSLAKAAGAGGDWQAVAVFERDPDLLDGTDPELAARLRGILVRAVPLARGTWERVHAPMSRPGDLGFLVLDGLVGYRTQLGPRRATELLGPGDVFHPAVHAPLDGSVPATGGWHTLTPASIALLDARFNRITARCPSVGAVLLDRAQRRAQMLTELMALASHRMAATRVLLALWLLADRWGRVTRDGVVIPYALTHRQLGELAALGRPTVTSVLGELTAAGDVRRRDDGTWLLTGEPPRSRAVV